MLWHQTTRSRDNTSSFGEPAQQYQSRHQANPVDRTDLYDEKDGEIHVCTLEYRPIDILLGDERSGVDADAWSLGVVLPDMVGMPFARPLARDTRTTEITAIMFEQLGTPPQRLSQLPHWKHFPVPAPQHARKEWPEVMSRVLGCAGVKPLKQLLDLHPTKCPNMREIGAHPYCHLERLARAGSTIQARPRRLANASSPTQARPRRPTQAQIELKTKKFLCR